MSAIVKWAARGLAAALLVLPAASSTWAGAWTVPRDRWYFEHFYRYYGSKNTFDNRGDSSRRTKTAHFSDIRNEWKLEYGLTNWLNLLVSAPYQSAHYRDDSVDLLNSGVGDIYVRAKLRPFVQPVTTSVQFSWKIPSAYDPKVSPGLGDGQVDFESRLLLSKAFVYWPDDIPVVHREDGTTDEPGREPPPPPKTTRPSPAASSRATPDRDTAMREAVMTAEMYQRGRQLLAEGRVREAAAWLRAVLENEPPHQDARNLLRQIDPEAEAALPPPAPDHAPGANLVTASANDTIVMETRYNGIAFLNLEGAFNARNEEPANEFPMVFEAGFTPFKDLKRLMLVGRLDSVVGAGSTHEAIENWLKWDVRAVLNLWGDGFASVLRGGHRTVNLEVGYSDVLAGRNTADSFEVYGKLGFFF